MMKIIKPAIGMIVLAFTSLILITGSPFQIASNLVENNGHLSIKNFSQEAYAEDGDGGGDDGGGDDGGGDDGGGGDDDSADGEGDSADEGEDGDSEDSSSGEDFDDGSGGSGSDEPTSTPTEDSPTNIVEGNNDANVDNSAPDFFSHSDVAPSTPQDGPSNDDDGGVYSPPSDFFSIPDNSKPISDNGQSNLQAFFGPKDLEVEPTAETSTSSPETEALQDVDIPDADEIKNSDIAAIEHAQQHGAQIEAEEKKSCEANDGKYKDGKCKFKDGDDSDAAGSFDHDLEEKGLYDNYAQRNADDSSEENPKNKDSDGDGIYDDEELSEEEEKALARDEEEKEEEDDKQYVDEKCDASEDYEANKKECDKLYDALEEDEKNDINSFEDGIISKETNKEDCEEDSGTWVDGKCDLDEEQY